MEETFKQIDKWLQEAKDELDDTIYATEEAFHRGEVSAYTKVGVLLQRHLTSQSSRPDNAEAQLQTFSGVTCEVTNTKNQQSGG